VVTQSLRPNGLLRALGKVRLQPPGLSDPLVCGANSQPPGQGRQTEGNTLTASPKPEQPARRHHESDAYCKVTQPDAMCPRAHCRPATCGSGSWARRKGPQNPDSPCHCKTQLSTPRKHAGRDCPTTASTTDTHKGVAAPARRETGLRKGSPWPWGPMVTKIAKHDQSLKAGTLRSAGPLKAPADRQRILARLYRQTTSAHQAQGPCRNGYHKPPQGRLGGGVEECAFPTQMAISSRRRPIAISVRLKGALPRLRAQACFSRLVMQCVEPRFAPALRTDAVSVDAPPITELCLPGEKRSSLHQEPSPDPPCALQNVSQAPVFPS